MQRGDLEAGGSGTPGPSATAHRGDPDAGGSCSLPGAVPPGSSSATGPRSTSAEESGGVPPSATPAGKSAGRGRSSRIRRMVELELQGSCKLRGVRADRVLRLPGCMMRNTVKDAFRFSREVQALDAFVSHSWQASAYAKHITLCVYYRGRQGVLACLAAAVLGPLACPIQHAKQMEVYKLLGVGCGLMALALCVLFWPCRRMVFLDKACIDQQSAQTKRDGVMSIGAFLRSSSTTLVLWDESYFSRRWCAFEFAASLKLMEGRSKAAGAKLAVYSLVQTVMMLVSLVISVLYIAISRGLAMRTGVDTAAPAATLQEALRQVLNITAVVFLLALVFDRGMAMHSQSFRTLHRQLQRFSIEDTHCSCCTLGHVDPATGQPVECDKEIIEETIVEWFGSAKTFKTYVQETVKSNISLSVLVSYRVMLLCCLPLLLDGIGGSIWLVKVGQNSEALVYLLTQIYAASVTMPLAWHVVFNVHENFRWNPPCGPKRILPGILRATLVAVGAAPHNAAVRLLLYACNGWAYGILVPVFGGLTVAVYRYDFAVFRAPISD